MTKDHAQSDLDADQGLADLDQALGDRQQHIVDREQATLDRREGDLACEEAAGRGGAPGDAERRRRKAEIELAQDRRSAEQLALDDAQRTRDEHQELLDGQQFGLAHPPPAVPHKDPRAVERLRVAALHARADAMDERAQKATDRAVEARRRAHDAAVRADGPLLAPPAEAAPPA